MKGPIDPERFRQDLHIEGQLCGATLKFNTTWGLFSPKAIDEGTILLLDHMPIKPDDRCLDLGCGYGPMGLSMAQQAPKGSALLVDKDFVAVDYSRINAKRNALDNVDVRLSNGFSHIEANDRFDLIASNLPAKTGKELYYLYFFDALARLNPGGRFYVVTITGLRKFVQKAFIEVFGNYDKVKQGQTYTVAMAYKEDDA